MEEEKGKSFGKIAENYDKYRPTYPKKMYKDILKMSNINKSDRILDIGTGTGKGCKFFSGRNYRLICIEPDKRLIEISKKNLNLENIEFINSIFEEANLSDQNFSLIISAQAFHWINLERGIKKLSALLDKKGYFAFFWNIPDFNFSNSTKKVDELINEYSGENFASFTNKIDSIKAKLEESSYFSNVEKRKYSYFVEYSKNEYIELFKTFSSIFSLPKKSKKEFLSKLSDIVPKKIRSRYYCYLISGKKN